MNAIFYFVLDRERTLSAILCILNIIFMLGFRLSFITFLFQKVENSTARVKIGNLVY